jgi:hypothetical protein
MNIIYSLHSGIVYYKTNLESSKLILVQKNQSSADPWQI